MLDVALVVVAEAEAEALALEELALELITLESLAVEEVVVVDEALELEIELVLAAAGFTTDGCSIINLASLVTTELLKGIIFFNRIG